MRVHILMSMLLIFAVANVLAQAAPGNIVKYHTTINDVKYVYASAMPVARLKPGTFLTPIRSTASAMPSRSRATRLA